MLQRRRGNAPANGQLECQHNHVSMQATSSSSPSSNSPKHTTHVSPSSPLPETTPPSTVFLWYVCVGIICTQILQVPVTLGHLLKSLQKVGLNLQRTVFLLSTSIPINLSSTTHISVFFSMPPHTPLSSSRC
ncbi:hypothetical protein V8G54_012175 [Vigna mungo]|uniref:Uncharacterized protein n=1 Tax=Vigna mungo TaxID=3915 RepID=A0AAQ3NQZ2_VIGMU